MRQLKSVYYWKNLTFHVENKNWLCQKTVFIAIFTFTYWVKPTLLAEPIFFTPTLLMGVTPAEPTINLMKGNIWRLIYLLAIRAALDT